MQPADGSFTSVKNAVMWSIDEILLNTTTHTLPLICEFKEGNTFELYQDPEVGWMTTDALKLGRRAQTLTFRYSYENDSPCVELLSCKGTNPMSLTAIKTAVLMGKLLTKCQAFDEDIPCAQPQSLSQWNFPKLSGWINTDSLKKYNEEERISSFFKRLNPVDPATSFAVGCPYLIQGSTQSITGCTEGDIVAVKRTKGAPTFAKVIEVADSYLKVALGFKETGEVRNYKDIPSEQIPYSVLIHWDSAVEPTRGSKKRKLSIESSDDV